MIPVLLSSFRVEHPSSGRFLEMFSTEPGVQFYTSFYLNETGKGGAKYEKFGAFCLEAQHYPDSPNKVSFRVEFINAIILFPSKRSSIPEVVLKYFLFILAKFSNDAISTVRNLSTNNYIQIWSDVILMNANIVFILFYVMIF